MIEEGTYELPTWEVTYVGRYKCIYLQHLPSFFISFRIAFAIMGMVIFCAKRHKRRQVLLTCILNSDWSAIPIEKYLSNRRQLLPTRIWQRKLTPCQHVNTPTAPTKSTSPTNGLHASSDLGCKLSFAVFLCPFCPNSTRMEMQRWR